MIDFLRRNFLWILFAVIFCALPFVLNPPRETPETFRKNVENSGFTLPEREQEIVRVWLVGDTHITEVSESVEETTGASCWATQLAASFNQNAYFLNVSQMGESSYSFLSTYGYDSIRTKLQKGDLVLIQFGNRDASSNNPETGKILHTDPLADPAEANESGVLDDGTISFRAILRKAYLEPIREAGATPIILSPIVLPNSLNMPDRTSRLADYRDAMKAVAEEDGVLFYDLFEESYLQFKQIYDLEGEKGVLSLYAHAPDDPETPQVIRLSSRGAKLIAADVQTRLLQDYPELQDYLKEAASDPELQSGFDPNPS